LVTTSKTITPSDIGATAFRVRLSFLFSFIAGKITYRLFYSCRTNSHRKIYLSGTITKSVYA